MLILTSAVPITYQTSRALRSGTTFSLQQENKSASLITPKLKFQTEKEVIEYNL